MTRKTLKEIKEAAFQEGFLAGKAHADMLHKQQTSREARQLELMRAVTQLISVSGQTVQSLAQVYDNGPRG